MSATINNFIDASIPLTGAQYTIEIRPGLLNDTKALCNYLAPLGHNHVIITDDIIAKLYGNQLGNNLSSNGLKTTLLQFKNGEENKTRHTKEMLENEMLNLEMGKDTCIIAIGGGVTSDIAGYLAATYCRGIPLVIIPTTLLGMVDASIGGKNGVNTPHGKNLIGTLHAPKAVLIDPNTLKTLPQLELRNGFAEMIKHGLITNKDHFQHIEENADKLLSLESTELQKAIYDSCQIKNVIVKQDAADTGKRNLLNFGHTIGHALENISDYTIPHGEAVAIGMLAKSHIAMQQGIIDENSFQRIKNILFKFSLPLKLPKKYTAEALLKSMILDKKSRNGTPRLVMIDGIGSATNSENSFCSPLDSSLITNSLNWIAHDLHRH